MALRLRRCLLVGISASVLALVPFPASAEPSCIAVGWEQADANCVWTYQEYQQTSSGGGGHTWYVTIQPNNGGIQKDDLVCTEGEETGLWHDVFMDGTDVGDVCVPDSDVDQVSIAQLIIRQFKRIKWPASRLIVQPPGGKTLVNFKTNFFSPNHQSIDQSLSLANRDVEIRAVPTSYTFHFGDDTSTTTAQPGRPHPHMDVTHEYARTGSVIVSLDTTYSGEYRIGDGDWVAIPDTLTVVGEGQHLEILEAIPQLVLR